MGCLTVIPDDDWDPYDWLININQHVHESTEHLKRLAEHSRDMRVYCQQLEHRIRELERAVAHLIRNQKDNVG